MIDGDVIIKDFVKSEKGYDDIFLLEKEILNDPRARLFSFSFILFLFYFYFALHDLRKLC